tara:strand:- start:8404 stop:8976 length:573 start_codon:yes stop_codon:yes gene_type:complete
MDTISFYAQLGFNHVIDFEGLDHFYFIIALAIPFGIREFQKLLWWVSIFTLGHTLSLFGNYYFELTISAQWIEFLIPATIAFSCIPLLITKEFNHKTILISIITLFFGLIHGFGFGRYFSLIVSEDEALTDLFSFALGVEAAQIIIVLGVLLLSLFAVNILKINRSKWHLIIGAMILSQAILMMIEKTPI